MGSQAQNVHLPNLNDFIASSSQRILKGLYITESLIFALSGLFMVFMPSMFLYGFIRKEYLGRVMGAMGGFVPYVRHIIQLIG